MTVPHNASAKHGAAFSSHNRADLAIVLAVLARHDGPENAATEIELAREAGMPERRFRACLADYDGIAFLIGKVTRSKAGAGGLFLVVDPEDAKSLSAELASKRDTISDRLGRRAHWCGQRDRVTQLPLLGVA